MAIRNSIKRAGIQMKDPPRAGAKKKLPHKETAFLCAYYLFDNVSIQSCKDVIYIAVSVDVEVDRFRKIQAEDSHD